MKQLWQRLKAYPATVLFFLFIFGFMIVDATYPTREFSELENTKLSQRPAFSFSALMNNEWTADYASYIKDQVAFRDAWIDLQSRSESLLFQKAELGGMLMGKDNMMFTRMFALKRTEQKQLPANISAVEQFAARHPGQVTFLLAPSASVIYSDYLPFHAPMLDESGYLDEIFSRVEAAGANILDLRGLFTEHRDEYLYYRTDHHWTTHGAYLAYTAFCRQQGLVPFVTAAHQAVEVENFYGTSYSASRAWNAVPDILTYYELPNQMTIYNTPAEGVYETASTGKMYNYDALSTRDKYAVFLHGNPGYSVIEGDGEGSILVVKDSYANSFIPFLTANYAKVGVVDFRNFPYGLDGLMQNEGYEQVLILYNFQTFKSDGKLYTLNRNPIE